MIEKSIICKKGGGEDKADKCVVEKVTGRMLRRQSEQRGDSFRGITREGLPDVVQIVNPRSPEWQDHPARAG